jgi:hypothetical protein
VGPAAGGHQDDLQAVAKGAIVGGAEEVAQAVLLVGRQTDTDHEPGRVRGPGWIRGYSCHYAGQRQPEHESEQDNLWRIL